MRIHEFAMALGVCPDTIRRAERRGLLKPTRDWAGHRRYTEADLERARRALSVPAPHRTGRAVDGREVPQEQAACRQGDAAQEGRK